MIQNFTVCSVIAEFLQAPPLPTAVAARRRMARINSIHDDLELAHRGLAVLARRTTSPTHRHEFERLQMQSQELIIKAEKLWLMTCPAQNALALFDHIPPSLTHSDTLKHANCPGRPESVE